MTEAPRRPASELATGLLVLLSCLLIAVAAGLRLHIPAPPTGGAEPPAFGAGSDWDRQWAMTTIGANAARAGRRPDWDPFTGAGAPLAANPESMVLHPAFRLGALVGDGAALQALFAASVFIGSVGASFLLRILGGSPTLGPVLCAVWLISPELTTRTYAGHVMAWGIFTWPMAFAGLLHALDSARRGRRLGPGLGGAITGASMALASPGGAHYPTLLGTLALALTGTLDAVLGPQRIRVLQALPAMGLGAASAAAAVAGRRTWEAFDLFPLSERSIPRTGDAIRIDRPPWADLLDGGSFALEGALDLGGLAPYAAAGVGVLLLLRRRPALGLPAAGLGVAGFLAGSAWDPWSSLARWPPFSLLDYPGRLQWFFLIFGPIGLALGLESLLQRLPLVRRWTGLLLLAVALGWVSLRFEPIDRRLPAAQPTDRFPPGEFRGIAEPGSHLVSAVVQGRVDPDSDLPLTFDHPALDGPAGALVWGEAEAPRIHRDAAALVVQGSPNARILVLQRHLPGWSCEGASVEAAPWDRRLYWLAMTLGPSGQARCEWRSPVATKARWLQLGAWGVLVTLLLAGWREGRGPMDRQGRPAAATAPTTPPVQSGSPP